MTGDNKKTGEVAVDAVQYAFRSVKNVLCHLNKDDTGVCIDGYIEVYRSEACTKESLIGEIPVQVKGTRRKPSRKDCPTYSVKLLDLKKFSEVFGGVLYFVVYEDDDYNTKGIFYKTYLSYDVEKALDVHEGKKKFTETFTALPDDTLDRQRLLMEFVTDHRKQRGSGIRVFKDGDGLRESGIAIDHLEFTKTVFGNEDMPSLKIMHNPTYLYGVTKEGMLCVFDKIESLEDFQCYTSCVIGSGDYSSEYSAAWGEDTDGEYFEFGGFVLRFGKPGTIKYRERGTFRERLRDARLFLALVSNREISVNGGRLDFNDLSFTGNLVALKKRIARLEYCVELFDILGVQPDWDPDRLTSADWHVIGVLGRAFVDGKRLSFGSHAEKAINYNADVCGARIKALAILQDDGKYKLYDPTSEEIVYIPDLGEKEGPNIENRLPAILAYGSEDYQRCANISEERFKAAFERCAITAGNSEAATNSLLSMLLAYDRGATCGADLLSCCKVIAEALYTFAPSSEIAQINRAQVLARQGATDDATRRQLLILAVRSGSDTVRASANILLGQGDTAAVLIEGFDEVERKRFFTWPIYDLLQVSDGASQEITDGLLSVKKSKREV